MSTTINGTKCCAKCKTPYGHSAEAGQCCHPIVYPMNRHKGYGIPVSVVASSKQEAINKAVDLGWGGRASDARVSVETVEEIAASEPQAAPEPSGSDRLAPG